jgi:hypothetical protein
LWFVRRIERAPAADVRRLLAGQEKQPSSETGGNAPLLEDFEGGEHEKHDPLGT